MTNIFDNAINFFSGLFIKFVARMPQANFNLSSYINSFSTIKGNINYFIPFYLFKDIFSAFVLLFWGTVTILFIIRFMRKGVGL